MKHPYLLAHTPLLWAGENGRNAGRLMDWDNDNLLGKKKPVHKLKKKRNSLTTFHWETDVWLLSGKQDHSMQLLGNTTEVFCLLPPFPELLLLRMEWNGMHTSDQLGSAVVVVSPPSHLPISLSTCWMAWREKEREICDIVSTLLSSSQCWWVISWAKSLLLSHYMWTKPFWLI